MSSHRSLDTLRRTACALLLGLAAAAAQAQSAAVASQHATRSGQAFAQLEESLLKAQRERRAEALGELLDQDFVMVVAQEGGATVPREDWVDSALKPGAGNWVVSQLSAREFGNVALVSLVLRPVPPPGSVRAGGSPLAVVDTWTRSDKAFDAWRLVLRHVASAAGSRKGIPGDAPTRAVIKKY